jgi:multimeric flavodoxin WrbA
MKSLILFGSPRKDGNTRQLMDAITEVIKREKGDVRVLYLNDMNIRPCQACRKCADTGICRINDDMKDVHKYVRESDTVVFATPVYWSGPSAQMKLVMDRSVAFLDNEFKSRVQGKKGVVLLSCGDEAEEMCTPSLEMFRKTFEGLGIIHAGHVVATGCDGKGVVSAKALEKASEVAASLL